MRKKEQEVKQGKFVKGRIRGNAEYILGNASEKPK